MIPLSLVHAVIDQAAGSNICLIEARAAGEHRSIDARFVHHPHMRRKLGEQRIEPVIGISIFVDADATTIAHAPLHQLGRGVMVLEIDDHFRRRFEMSRQERLR
jgi:hypothetical protein